MAIPKKVNICGLVYDIVHEEILAVKHGCVGMHFPETLQIKLQTQSVSPQKIEQTFVHEIIHAISNILLNDKLDEETVNTLANGLYCVFKDNNFLNRDVFNASNAKGK